LDLSLFILSDKAREARQLGPETICEFLSEARSEALESGRSGPQPHAESAGAPLGDGAEERETDTLIPVSWSAGTGLGVVDDDNEVELNILCEDRTGAGDNVLRLEPWVNQVSVTRLVFRSWILLNVSRSRPR